MRRYILMLSLLLAAVVPAFAGDATPADRQAFREIISDQISAFRADDGPRAYSHAAPIIKQLFPTPDAFMSMVRRGYQPIYRPDAVEFGEVAVDPAGRPTQTVTVVAADGFTYDAIYTMQQQPDGTWRIGGCRLVRKPGLST